MSLLPHSITIAAEIDGINRETLGFLRAQAARAYALANTEGHQQAVMDALGPQAASALQSYAVIHGALTSLGAAEDLPAPDFDKWQVAENGTVTFVPPPQEEPATPEP